jgi:aspartyl protease/PDZ domain-containing protein
MKGLAAAPEMTSKAKRTLLAALIALVGGAALAENTPVARVPFELNGNLVFLRVRVNGSQPLWFALDTGAQGSTINVSTARALDLTEGRAGTSHGAAGAVPNVEVRHVTFDVGGAFLKDLAVAAMSLTELERAAGRPMDGILGSELFRRWVVRIDYDAKEIRLFEPEGFDYRGDGEVLPIAFHDEHPYVRATVTLPGRAPFEGEFVVDAGSNLPLILLPGFLEKNGLRASLPPTLNTYGRGIGGELILPMGRASRLELGRFLLDGPITAFPKSGTFGRAGKAGNIGSAVLRRFRVTFDYSRRRMILEPGVKFEEPFDYDMSGLQLVSETPTFDVVRVNRVLANSPAADAGIRPADEILTFGGRPSKEIRLADLREMLRQPGRQYSLILRRGAETLAVDLKTRPLL